MTRIFSFLGLILFFIFLSYSQPIYSSEEQNVPPVLSASSIPLYTKSKEKLTTKLLKQSSSSSTTILPLSYTTLAYSKSLSSSSSLVSSSIFTKRSLAIRPVAATPDNRAGTDGCWSLPYKTPCKYLPPNGDESTFSYGPDYTVYIHPILIPVFTHNFTLRINTTAINVPNPAEINGLIIIKLSLGGIDRRDGTGNIIFPNGCIFSSSIPVMDYASGSTTLPPKPYVVYDLTIQSENGQNGCWFGSRYEYLVRVTIEGFASSANTVASTNFQYTLQNWIDGYSIDTNSSNIGYAPIQSATVTPSPYWWDLTPTPSPDYNNFFGNDPDTNPWWLTADISSATPSPSSSPTIPIANLVPPNILPITSTISLTNSDSITANIYPGQSQIFYIWNRLTTNNNNLAYSSISSNDPDTFSIGMDNYVGYTLYLESNNTDAVAYHTLTIRSGYVDMSTPFTQWGECTAIAHNNPLDSSSNFGSYLTLDVTYDSGCYFGAPSVTYIRISYDESNIMVNNKNEPLNFRLSGSVMQPSATTTPTPSNTPSNTQTPTTTCTLTSTGTSTHTATVTPSITPTPSTTMIFRSIVLPSATGKDANLNITDNGLPDIFKNGGLIIKRDNSATPSPNYGPSDLLDPPFGTFGEGFPDPNSNTKKKDTAIIIRNAVDYNNPKYYRMTTSRDMGINLVWLAGISTNDNQPILIEAALYGPPSSVNNTYSAYQWLPQFIGKLDDPINITDIENVNYTLPIIEKNNRNVTIGMSGSLSITRCELAFALGYPCDDRFSALYRTLWFRIRVLRPATSHRRQLGNATLVAPSPVNLPGATGVPFSVAMDWNYNDGEGITGVPKMAAEETIDLAMLIPTIIGVLLVLSVGIYLFIIGPAHLRQLRDKRIQQIKGFLNSSSSSSPNTKKSKSNVRSPPSKAHLSAVPSLSVYGKPIDPSVNLGASIFNNEVLPPEEILVSTGTVSKDLLSDILIQPVTNNTKENREYFTSPIPKVSNAEWDQYGEQIIDISENFEPAAILSLSEENTEKNNNENIRLPVRKDSVNNPLASFDAEIIATIQEQDNEDDHEIHFDTDETKPQNTSFFSDKLSYMDNDKSTGVVSPAKSSTKRVQYSDDNEYKENGNIPTDDTNEPEESSEIFTRILHKQHPSMYVKSDEENNKDTTDKGSNDGDDDNDNTTSNDNNSTDTSMLDPSVDAASLLMSRMERELRKTGSAVAAAGVGLGMTSQTYNTMPTSVTTAPTSRRVVLGKGTKAPRTTGIIIPPIIPLSEVNETMAGSPNMDGIPELSHRRSSGSSLDMDDMQVTYPRGSFAESITSAHITDDDVLAELDKGIIPSLEESRNNAKNNNNGQYRSISFSSGVSSSSSSVSNTQTMNSNDKMTVSPDRRTGSIISSSNNRHRGNLTVLVDRIPDNTNNNNDDSNRGLPILTFATDKRGEVPKPPHLPVDFKQPNPRSSTSTTTTTATITNTKK